MKELISKILNKIGSILHISVRILVRIIFWVAVSFATVLVLLIILGWTLYGNGYFHQLIKENGEKLLGDYTEVEVDFGEVTGTIFTGLNLKGVIIGNGPSIAEDGIAIAADELHVRYNPLKMLSGKVVIDDVYLVGGEVNLLAEEERGVNFARIFDKQDEEDDDKPSNFKLEIEHIELDGVTYFMDVGSPIRDFENLNVESSLSVIGSTVFISVGEGTCYLPEFNQWLPEFGNGEIIVDDGRVLLRGIDVSSPTTNITCSGSITTRDDLPLIDLEFSADPLDLGECLKGVLLEPPETYGIARYEGRLYGIEGDMTQEGHLELDNGYIYNIPVSDLTADYSFDIEDEKLTIFEMQGDFYDTAVEAEGDVYFPEFGDPYFDVDAYAEHIDLGNFLHTEDMRSDVAALANVTGSVADTGLSVSVVADVGPGKVSYTNIDSARVNFDMVGTDVTFHPSSAVIGEGTVLFEGDIGPEQLSLKVEGEDVSLGRLRVPGIDGLSGIANFNGVVYGPLLTPTFNGRAAAYKVAYGDIYAGVLETDGIWENLGGDNKADVTLRAWDAEIAGLPVDRIYLDVIAFDEYITANECKLYFGEEKTVHFSGLLNIDEKSFTFKDAGYIQPYGEIKLTNQWRIEFPGNRIESSEAHFTYKEGSGKLSGSVNLARETYTVDLLAQNIPIAELLPEAPEFYYEANLDTLKVFGEGSFTSPALEANATLSDIYLNNETLTGIDINVSLDNDVIVVDELRVDSNTGYLSGNGTIPLAVFNEGGGGIFGITLDSKTFDLTVINAFSDVTFLDAGVVSGEIELTGTALSPHLTTDLTLSNLRKDTATFDEFVIKFDYENELLAIDDVSLHNAGKRNLKIDGTIGLDLPYLLRSKQLNDGNINLDVNVDSLSFVPINTVYKDVYFTNGTLNMNSTITGSILAPHINGTGELENLSGIIGLARSNFSGVNGRFDLAHDKINISEQSPITFDIGEGTGVLFGDIRLSNLIPSEVDLQLNLEDYLVTMIPGVWAYSDIDMYQITGPFDDLVIRGDARIKSGLVTMSFGATMGDAYAMPTDEKMPDFDFHVVTDGDFWLRNRDSDILLTADLNILTENNQIIFKGNLVSERGMYYFLKRDFTITSTELTFAGDPKINPRLDIVGETIIRGEEETIDIVIYVTGTAFEPEITLECPQHQGLDQSDLMVMLGLNVTYQEYINMSKGDIAVQESADYVKRMAEKEVAILLRKSTGLDYVNLQTEAEEDDTEVEVTFGHYLTDDLFIQYTGKYEGTETDQNLEHDFGIEYQLIKNFYLVGSSFHDEEAHRYGTSLKYKIKY